MIDWKRFLVLGLSATLAIPLVGFFGSPDLLCFMIGFYAILGMCWGIVSGRPRLKAPWMCLLSGVVLQFSGGLIQANSDASGEFGAALSIADGFLFVGHLCFILALWQFASRLHRDFPRHGFFQGCVLATSLVLIGWLFLFLPTIAQYGFALGQPQTFRMVYPSMAYVEVGMLLWIWTSSEAYRSKVFLLLCMAVITFAAGESLYHGTSASLAVPGNFNVALWACGYLGFGVVAMHPDMALLSVPRHSEEGRHGNNVAAWLLPLVLLLPVALLIVYFRELHPATIGILGGFFLLMVLGWVELRSSIHKIVQTNRLLEKQSWTDQLTGIPNRSYIEHQVRAGGYPLDSRNGLLLIDIDGFKSINNLFGFHVGDQIIQAIAHRLHAACSGDGQHFARVDGDEFALLMLDIKERESIEAQAWRIHRLLEEPVVAGGAPIRVMCSIGVSLSGPFEKLNFASMLKESERALGWARESQSQVKVYDKTKDIAEDRSWVLTDFRAAVAASQLVVHYQPKVHALSRKVIGVEALIRWQHPQRGLLMPDDFMPKIEATDLAHEVFTVVLHDAARQWQAWRAQGLVIGIALNVVARDIMDFDLVAEIATLVAQTGLPASQLEIEIKE